MSNLGQIISATYLAFDEETLTWLEWWMKSRRRTRSEAEGGVTGDGGIGCRRSRHRRGAGRAFGCIAAEGGTPDGCG